MYPINFLIKNLQGLDGCKRMGLDDTLAISIVLNTTKQIHPDFEKTFFWSSENQKNQAKSSKK
jgi:hypothetical protein